VSGQRQIYRLLDAFQARRPGWSDFPKCGRPSNRELGPVFRETVLAIVRERYGDFGPTLAAEKLSDAGSKPVDVIAVIVFWN
jgi:hypothetical protein